MAINNPEKVVLAENSDHNFPDGTKQPCFLLCPCVYLGLLLVSWLLKCLSALNTGPDRGKSKNKLAFGRAITFLEEGRTLPFAYYFGLTSASLHLPREQMKTVAHRQFCCLRKQQKLSLQEREKETCLLFKFRVPP